ncbi:unnamed protein product [Adineta steineri]|uniref:Uncharacterized protein n=1 Tax=Adineta steineri TaxID=433720 RepID=A0A815CW26_9BILA|nr:unnamed protein product [Adineta steineri]
MTTVKNPLARARLLQNISTKRTHTTSFSNPQNILPNYPLIIPSQNRPRKKRVRFQLKLESVKEEKGSSVSNNSNSTGIIAQLEKKTFDSLRESRLLHSPRITNLPKQDHSSSAIPKIKRPSRPSLSPESQDSLVYSRSFSMETFIHRPVSPRKDINNGKRQSPTFSDSSSKQRLHLATLSRFIQSKKIPIPMNDKNYLLPIVKRIDLISPTMKEAHSNEKLIQIENYIRIKTMKERFPSKKTSLNNQ